MFKKIIVSEFFTTVSFDRFLKSLTLLTFKLPSLRYGNNSNLFEDKLLQFLKVKNCKVISFYNWRSSIYHTLKLIDIKQNDEIIVSWYTCVSVSNAVIQSWWKIIYSDIEKETLWLDIEILKSNITKKTKIIIVQHTFWKPSKINEIIKLAKKNNILVIEDCAHSLGSKINSKRLWTFWDFAIFSTWRDKVISSVTWGFMLINNKKYFENIDSMRSKLLVPSRMLIVQNIMYNILWYLSYKTYWFFSLWKVVMLISRKFLLITEILTKEEKKCDYNNFNYSLPNSLAWLALADLEKIEKYNEHRNKIASYYDKNFNKIKKIFNNLDYEYNNYFRYPILCRDNKEKEKFINYMKENNVLMWKSWSWINIVPIWSNLKKSKYIPSSCKVAEEISKNILTLPNHSLVSLKDAKKIVELINKFKI